MRVAGLQSEVNNWQKRVLALEEATRRDLSDVSDLASTVQKNAVDRAVKEATAQLQAENQNLNKQVNMLIAQCDALKNNNAVLRETLVQ